MRLLSSSIYLKHLDLEAGRKAIWTNETKRLVRCIKSYRRRVSETVLGDVGPCVNVASSRSIRKWTVLL